MASSIGAGRLSRHYPAAALVAAALAGCAAAPPAATTAPAPAHAAVPAPTSPPVVAPAGADEAAAARQQAFADWVAAFRASARAAGIDEPTLAAAFDGVQYRPRVIERDRSQPEFTRTVWDYLDGALSPRRVAQGRSQLAQHRTVVEAAAARHGVPAATLVAIWGLESGYGADAGDIPTIDALATLGFEGRREAWARGELLAALRILQRGEIDRPRMLGSWAGAMGQTQFLPTTFLAHAEDGDGDGRRDIWGSLPDVLASTANFLAHAGWRADEPWGIEVRLPAGFDHGRADDRLRQPSERWAAEGVQAVDGAPLPVIGEASLLLPAGARGPAFLVGSNFRAVLRYNNSTSYALAVVLLAQRLQDGPGVQAPWPRELAALSRSQLQALQTALNARGFDSGEPDGRLGPATRDAVRRYQRSQGLPADGYPDLDLLRRLQGP